MNLPSRVKLAAGETGAALQSSQAMVDKSIAQRDVEYFNELLSKETDENRRTILLRLLADAEERLRRAEEQEERKN